MHPSHLPPSSTLAGFQERSMHAIRQNHILPDVQAVSDSVVILAKGSVRVSESLQKLSRPAEPAVFVKATDGLDKLAEFLDKAGVASEKRQFDELIVFGDPNELPDRVWQAASETGVVIRSMAPTRNSLEDVFIQAVQEQPHGS